MRALRMIWHRWPGAWLQLDAPFVRRRGGKRERDDRHCSATRPPAMAALCGLVRSCAEW